MLQQRQKFGRIFVGYFQGHEEFTLFWTGSRTIEIDWLDHFPSISIPAAHLILSEPGSGSCRKSCHLFRIALLQDNGYFTHIS